MGDGRCWFSPAAMLYSVSTVEQKLLYFLPFKFEANALRGLRGQRGSSEKVVANAAAWAERVRKGADTEKGTLTFMP